MESCLKRSAIGLAILLVFLCAGSLASSSAYAKGDAEDECANDADCDGLSNGQEDVNGNGEVDVGETDPKNPDTDGDGLTDGEERLHIGKIGELLSNEDMHIRFPDRFDPLVPDSDGDCLPDGVEAGVAKDEILSLLDRTPKRPRYAPSNRCRAILEANFVSELANAILYDEDEVPGLHNIAALFDIDPASVTDPTLDDTDGDGVIDGLEDYNFNGARDFLSPEDSEVGSDHEIVWLEMDPRNPDSDGDGVTDGEEGDRDGDGEIAGPDESDPIRADTDGDGVVDGDEVRAGTRPNMCDTDEDGLSDGVEMGKIQPYDYKGCHGLMAAGSNYKKPTEMDPQNPDSDGDGIADGGEDANGNGWVDSEESDPSIPDTDGDGLSDSIETLGDFDGDGVPDYDFQLIVGEGKCRPPLSLADVDCDGVPNARDDDSDNDGCSDSLEGGWIDANTNGIPDVYDPQTKVCPDDVDTGGGGGAPSESPAQDDARGPQASGLIFGSQDGGACALVGTVVDEQGLVHHAYITAFFLLSLAAILTFRLTKIH